MTNITDINSKPSYPGAKVVGRVPITSKATMLAYLLACELEVLNGPEATNLSSAAWALLDMIGEFERAAK